MRVWLVAMGVVLGSGCQLLFSADSGEWLEATESLCRDGVDNDEDGAADCSDDGCFGTAVCHVDDGGLGVDAEVADAMPDATTDATADATSDGGLDGDAALGCMEIGDDNCEEGDECLTPGWEGDNCDPADQCRCLEDQTCYPLSLYEPDDEPTVETECFDVPGTHAVGEACSFHYECERGHICGSTSIFGSSTCLEACDDPCDCVAGSACMVMGSQFVCADLADGCDPRELEACGEGEGCYFQWDVTGSNTFALCLPVGSVLAGEPCLYASHCTKGSTCRDNVCRPYCSEGADCAEKDYFCEFFPISGCDGITVGLCMPKVESPWTAPSLSPSNDEGLMCVE